MMAAAGVTAPGCFSMSETGAAANYEKLANANSVLGSYDDALAAEDTAIGIYQTLADAAYAPGSDNLPSAFNNRGNILNAAGRYDEARGAYEKAIDLRLSTGKTDALQMAQFYHNAGANAVSLGDEAAAADAFEESLRLLNEAPESSARLEAEARTCYNYGVLHQRNGRYGKAAELLSRAAANYETLLRETDSLQNRNTYVQTLSVLATCLTDAGDFEAADAIYADAIASAEELARDGENVVYERNLAELYNNCAVSQNIRARYGEADAMYKKAEELRRVISEKTGSAFDKSLHALILLNLGENAFKLGTQEQSRAYFERGLALYEEAIPELGNYDRAQAAAWRCYYELIHERDFDAALQSALEGFELQPNNVLVNLNLAYACLYAGYREEGEDLLMQIAALGGGQAETIRVDLEAQLRAGMPLENAGELMEKLGL